VPACGAVHPAPNRATVTRTRRTRVTVDPAQVAAEVEAFHATLERETALSLRRDPQRWLSRRTIDLGRDRTTRGRRRETAS
jgi:hypothetical protein